MAEGWLWKHKNMKSVDEGKERFFLVHFTLYSGAGVLPGFLRDPGLFGV